MGGFEYVEHTADAGLRIWAEDEQTLFVEAAKGMISLIVNPDTIQINKKISFQIKEENPEETLLNWLKEILYLMEVNHLVFYEFQFERFSLSNHGMDNCCISGFLGGEKLNKSRHSLCNEIKAVTRHDFYFKKKGTLWEAFVLFDL